MTEQIVPVKMSDGRTVYMHATSISGRAPASADYTFEFDEFAETSSAIAQAAREKLKELKPNKVSIELGLEVGIESGKLVAVLAKGSAKASMKVQMEWSE